jgi:hypothetical protein
MRVNPAPPLGPLTPSELRSFFDRIVVVNLERRPDRLASFTSGLGECGWPFRPPEVFKAVDGSRLPLPRDWISGDGAWGCMQSHRQILERAIIDGIGSLLVLEDDATFRPSFAAEIASFLAEVPSDWEGLMIGGQTFAAQPEGTAVVRCSNCQRTHAYAVRGPYLRALYQHWVSTTGHCDHRMGEIQWRFKVYAPQRFLVGQRRSKSDINGAVNPTKFWEPPSANAPVVLLTAPSEILPELRRFGFHTGHSLDKGTDLDKGLVSIFARPDQERAAALRSWIEAIQWEVASMEGAICTVWHPCATVALLRAATERPIIEVVAHTVEDAIQALGGRVGGFRNHATVAEAAVLLRVPKAVVQQLRGHGFHTGYWRDPSSDIDRGLSEIFADPAHNRRVERLREWFEVLAREAAAVGAVVSAWHPEVTSEMLALASRKRVVLIEAADVASALELWQRACAHTGGEKQSPDLVDALS